MLDVDAEENARLVHGIAARGPEAKDAEAALCRRFAERAWLYGRRHLRSDDRARDLAQAVMLAVLEAARAGRIDDPARVDRFVLGACRNVALRMRELDARAEPADHATLERLDVRALVPEPETIEVSRLTHCLAELEGRARQVVYLSFNEGRGADEIATALETTAGNVRVLRHRAVAQLRRCMDARKEAT
jgi:RNA polymerase sigma-70 factor (ECF subfamily)